VDMAGFVPDYSGVAVPDSHGVPFPASSHLNTDLFLNLHITIFRRMSTFFDIPFWVFPTKLTGKQYYSIFNNINVS